MPGADGIATRRGQRFAFELTTNVGNQQRADAAVMMQEQLRKIGVAVTIRQMEFNLLSDLLDQGKFDAVIIGTAVDTGFDLASTLGSKAIGGQNLSRYASPELDGLIQRSMSHPDLAAALPDLHAIQELSQREQFFTYLWESQRLCAYNRRLHEVRSNPLRTYFELEDWWLEARQR